MCVDVLSCVLLKVLGSRTGLTAGLVTPGLDRALGHAAHSFVRGAAWKDLRGVQGAAARAGGGARDAAGREAPAAACRGPPDMGKGKATTTTSAP